jgi:hypothetical protein
VEREPELMTPKLRQLLDRLAPVVREEVLKDFAPNCCIATGAILRRVFRYFHFDARPIACSVIIRNRKFYEATDAGEVPPEAPRALREWMDRRRAWAIGIVPESETGPNMFGGHVIMQVQDSLIDASLDLANRPQYDIIIPSFLVFHARASFLNFNKELVGRIDDIELVYRRLINNSYRSAPDWINESRGRRAVNAIIDRVERTDDVRTSQESPRSPGQNEAAAS